MRLIEKVWFKNHQARYWLVPLLMPLTGLFYLISLIRRIGFRTGLLSTFKIDKPVIIVGNISVGGNGKTPIVIHLVEMLKTLGMKPGVISRGYGGNAESYPYLLNGKSTTQQAGDEPILIYQRCNVPVVVGANRVANAQMLIANECNIIISDDGLQHYKLQRDLELVIIDAKRLFGNGLLMPAGPLREGLWRLKQADLVIYNGIMPSVVHPTGKKNVLMSLMGNQLINIKTGEHLLISEFLKQWSTVNAAAGIGEPQRFFDTLQSLGFNLKQQIGFIDHKDFKPDDFSIIKTDSPLLMTEKDAVKCNNFAQKNWWYLPVSAVFSEQDEKVILNSIKTVIDNKS